MGFGFLFVGFLLTFNVSFHHYTDVITTVLMLIGLTRLSPYARGFRWAFFLGLPLALFHAFTFFSALLDLIGLLSLTTAFLRVTAIVSILSKALFYAFTFYGIFAVSRETELPKVAAQSMRSLILTPLFFAAWLLLELNVFAYADAFLPYYLLGFLIFGILYTFFGAKTCFSCYVLICFEGEEEMERTPSRFALINKLNELSDRIDEKTLRRKEEERKRKASSQAERATSQGKRKKK